MVHRLGRWRRWPAIAAILAGGVVFQTTNGCSQTAATLTAELATSITDQYIRNFVSDWLGTGTGGLSGLAS